MLVQLPSSLRSLCTDIVRNPCGDRPSHGARAGIVQCHLRHVYGLRSYDFSKCVKLLAKPNCRGRGARESVRKSHSRLLPPQGGLAEAAGKEDTWAGYGLRRPIASQMWTRHKRWKYVILCCIQKHCKVKEWLNHLFQIRVVSYEIHFPQCEHQLDTTFV